MPGPDKASGSPVPAPYSPLAGVAKDRSAVPSQVRATSASFRTSDYGSEGWGFESLRAHPCDVSGHRARVSRAIVHCLGLWLVVLVGVELEVS